GVSWQGHLGGGLAGAVIAVPLLACRFGSGMKRWLGLLGIPAVPVAIIALIWISITDAERFMVRDVPLAQEAQEAVFAGRDKYGSVLLRQGDGLFGDPESLSNVRDGL